MTDTRKLPEHTAYRSTGDTAVVLALTPNTEPRCATLVTFTDHRGQYHVIELQPEELALLADDLGRVAHASPRQCEIWRLELELANSLHTQGHRGIGAA